MESKFEFSTDRASAVFTFDSVGKNTGNTYRGSFRVRTLLDPEQVLSAGRERRALLGSNSAYATDREHDLATALSELRARIIEAPPFWNNAKIPDDNILIEVLELAFDVEVEFRKKAESIAQEALNKLQGHIQQMQAQAKVRKATKPKEEAEPEEE